MISVSTYYHKDAEWFRRLVGGDIFLLLLMVQFGGGWFCLFIGIYLLRAKFALIFFGNRPTPLILSHHAHLLTLQSHSQPQKDAVKMFAENLHLESYEWE